MVYEAPKVFMHRFISPINNYEALAVIHGHLTLQVCTYEGRQCYVTGSIRVWGGKGRGYHNKLLVHFIDDGSIRMIPAGQFNKKAR